VKWWYKVFGDWRKCVQWEAELVWFRLRYADAAGPVKCINLLSRPAACGRVALYHHPGESVSQLYFGVPQPHLRLLQRMVNDFSFSVKPKPLDVEMPAGMRLTAVSALPWDKPFLAHIVDECVFMHVMGAGSNKGAYFPMPPGLDAREKRSAWRLPEQPPLGMTVGPSWQTKTIPQNLIATDPDTQKWLLGRSATSVPLHVDGCVNLYGRQEAAAAWLVQQVSRMLAVNHANLVVIDGVGDLVPQLKRKTGVTRLLGEQLTYIDMDGNALVTGLNPLAAAPGEMEGDTLRRWQFWFQGMHGPAQGTELLVLAWQDGVRDIPALQKWLKRRERQGVNTAVSTLTSVLNRLMAGRVVRDWLAWPINPFEILPQGALLFACKAANWRRQQLLQGMLLAVQQVPNSRIVVHGMPWPSGGVGGVTRGVISNGPLVDGSTVVLTESHSRGITALASRFLANDVQQTEHLELLRSGDSLVIFQNDMFFSTWNDRNS